MARVYCDKMTANRITRFLLKVAKCLSLMMKFEGGLVHPGAQGGWFSNSQRYTVYPKWCQIEQRSQLIANKKSYVGFQFAQKSMTLNGENGYSIHHICPQISAHIEH